ncbi:MAG: alanine--tRNA ligase [Candidatus Diapherotrites archaeon]
MKSDKEVKKEFKEKASKEPEKHYPVEMLKNTGFTRIKCEKCGKFAWTTDAERKVCGDAACSGGYQFIGNSPAKKQFDYLESWVAFRDFFKDLGYLEVKRYPVVARWRDDVYWVAASVYPFQPYVVSGEVKPPSNAVIIPQPSLRFNDIDNVGITGSHYVCFDMLGQLHFEKKEDYKPNLYFEEYYNWVNKGMGIPKDELILHEDAWAGGGTFGPCVEFFSRGCEIGNQVYMQYEVQEKGYDELKIKVLDMGQGHERIPWFTQGNSTSYETTFPTVVKKLKESAGIQADEKLMKKFLPYSAYLNVDEVEDIEKTWGFVAKELELDVKDLKDKVLPLAAIYSIAEHSRAALFGLNDGALPSNVGGGYNLRIILRRALGFIDSYGWDMDLGECAELHASYLKPLYDGLHENIEDVKLILESEKKKYFENKKRSMQIIAQVVKNKVDEKKLIELYDSHGINPDHIRKEAKLIGKEISVPEDFYIKVAERHEKSETTTATGKKEKIDFGLGEGAATEKLYWTDWRFIEFKGKVLAVKGRHIVLDKTAFYPTSGGQLNDIGSLGGNDVVDVFVQDNYIVHKLKDKADFKVGTEIEGKVDFERRKQLTQHHTCTHLVNLACQEILGPHCFQAGASKTLDKARLDITHYEQLSDENLKALEKKSNEYVKTNISVNKEILPRADAEKKYGMRIYQGGFIPGKKLRIVSVGDKDHEACGGTHLNSTKETGGIKIINSSRIQDGVIRINFACGKAADKEQEGKTGLMAETVEAFGVSPSRVPGMAKELFEKWKTARKLVKKGKKTDVNEFELSSSQESKGSEEELLKETAAIFSTQPEHVPKTAKRFLTELEQFREKLRGMK